MALVTWPLNESEAENHIKQIKVDTNMVKSMSCFLIGYFQRSIKLHNLIKKLAVLQLKFDLSVILLMTKISQ